MFVARTGASVRARMPPRLLLALVAAALVAVVVAAAWALTRPAEEREIPPIRIEPGAVAGFALVIHAERPLQEVT